MAEDAGDGTVLRRVHVSGLARERVRRYDGGIVEEDDLGWFFNDRGCEVDDVRLMVDPSTGRCRGFAFVDFVDEDSFFKALTLAEVEVPTGVPLDKSAKGFLRIQPAKPAAPAAKGQHDELALMRERTAGMERALRLREARVRELERGVRENQKRQSEAELQTGRNLQDQLAEERHRQDEIRRADEALINAETALATMLRDEQDRARALDNIVASTADPFGAVSRSGLEEPAAPADDEVAPAKPTSHEAVAGRPGEDRPLLGAFALPAEMGDEVRIKNTFIEFCVPPMAAPLRTQTAPAKYAVEDEGSAPAPALLPLPPATEVPAPWTLKREASNVSRKMLEEKMEAEESSADDVRVGLSRGRSRGNVAAGGPGSSKSSGFAFGPGSRTRWASLCSEEEAEETPGLAADSRASKGTPKAAEGSERRAWRADDGRKELRVRNLPPLPAELEAQLRAELARLWRVARGRSPPEIVAVQPAPAAERASYAAKGAGLEATVVFASSDDAAWLVDSRAHADWASTALLSLDGRVLQVEWPPQQSAPTDWRRMRHRADTDASSQVSYKTDGTALSRSGLERTSRSGEANLAMNRTVVVDGISTALPAHTVRDEVLSLLRRLWQRDGFRFDPQRDLHRGAEGIVVRQGRRRGEENDGSCVLRMRNYADAKFLAEQAKSLSIGGRPVRASWARSRRS